jgi:hypothetical protein
MESNKSWQEILMKLHDLHETRKSMSYASIYHGVYEDIAIKLNTKLFELTGKNYVDFSYQDIEDATAEFKLLIEGK